MRPSIRNVQRALSWLLPPVRRSLIRELAADRALLIATAVLLFGAWLPLFFTPFLPFCDLPLNTASAELLRDVLLGRAPAVKHFAANPTPVPYWAAYTLASALGAVFGPLLGAKLMAAIIMALIPLATMRLMLALDRDPRLGLWAFALVWQQNLYAGWLAYMLGIALVTFVLAWMIEAETPWDGLRLAPYTTLIALTHVQATMLLGVAGIGLAFTTGPIRRRLMVHALAGTGAMFMTLLWIVLSTKPDGGSIAASTFEWHPPSTRLSNFFMHTLDNFANRDGERWAAITFAILVLGPLALTQLPPRPVRDKLSPFVLVAAAGLLYSLLWWAVDGPITHWYTYPRYAIVVLQFLLLVPQPNLRGLRLLALAPGIFALLVLDIKAVQQFSAFAQRTRPLLELIELVRPKAPVLAMVFDDHEKDPNLKAPPYRQLFAYVTAVKHGYSPYLWTSTTAPLVYRPEGQLLVPGGAFIMDREGKQYDYVLVQAFQNSDPVHAAAPAATGERVKLLRQAGRWRLYEIVRP